MLFNKETSAFGIGAFSDAFLLLFTLKRDDGHGYRQK
jgi:hypothetical protein